LQRIRFPEALGMMGAVLKASKRSILGVARQAGVFSGLRDSAWRERKLLILCYHGISAEDEHLWDPELYMPPSLFRKRLETIRRNGYKVLLLGEALDRLQTGSLDGPSVVLTFDDGAHDFYTQAFPLLREFNAPATVYLTTYYCQYNRPVFNTACSYLLWKARGRTLEAKKLTGQDRILKLATPQDLLAARGYLQDHVAEHGYSAAEKDELLATLSSLSGFDYHRMLATRLLHLMNPREVTEVAHAGIDVQLHTHRHRVPSDKALFTREIEENRAFIEALTGRPAVDFCYPSGVHRQEFLPWLEELEVRSAVTCNPGFAGSTSLLQCLPRIVDTCRISPLEFEGWLSGAASFLPRRKLYSEY
jgi:peptidoglycan/xylan/chitin deacetylase (PgdA/CDA1 family)